MPAHLPWPQESYDERLDANTAIILAAIEKARNSQTDETMDDDRTAQPQRSKIPDTIDTPMDWDARIDQPPATDAWQKIHKGIQSNLEAARKTPEYEEEGRELATDGTAVEWTGVYVANLYRAHYHSADAFRAIADAHNAALAEALPDERWVAQQLQAANTLCEGLQQQLAAERGNRDGFRRALEQRIGEVDELRQQLLAAEVAIAEHNKTVATFKPPMQGIIADLSALAAEREKREQDSLLYERTIDAFSRQLLAAQAAIAEVEDHNIRGTLSPEAIARHDAEMMWKGRTAQAADDRKHYEAQRKPLVDALTPFSKLDSVITLEDVKRAADVLAKVEEGK